ncbi:MAG: N(4)-(beta-N-acetylglucosaminyl)-L-asparaginase [Pirellulales bacterium]|nr:N(4)-(beta-N-acetylglucosaminyl)-L-asparaginase [Pirellulales bacterium]
MKVIASGNALTAAEHAYELLSGGAEALNAVVEGLAVTENDPDEVTVGFGSLPNADGVLQLDAAIMHGPTHQGGAVAAVEGFRHPTQIARRVMEATDHVLLVGEGANQFAASQGFEYEDDLLTDRARKIWQHWRDHRKSANDWTVAVDETTDPEVAEFFRRRAERPQGTAHLSLIDASGDISCATTTSGQAFKLPGRVGDSPIFGAGLYVDNPVGSCGSIGLGELNQRELSSFLAVELMRSGQSPTDAGLEVLRRIAGRLPARLRDDNGHPKVNLQLFLLSADGTHAGVCMRGPKNIAVADGARLEPCTELAL